MYAMFLIVSWQPVGAIWLSLNSVRLVCLFKVVVIVEAGGRQPWSGVIDLDAMPVMMEIMFVLEDGDRKHKEERPYHITYYELHVMLILLCILYCLVHDGSIIR